MSASSPRPLAAGAVVIDVREPYEYASGHVPGALSIPMHLVPLRVDEIPSDRDVYVICAAGNRSWQVCHYLGQRGIEATNVTGGTACLDISRIPRRHCTSRCGRRNAFEGANS